MALIKNYFELTEKYQLEYGNNTVLLMQVGSFFEIYGEIDNKTNIISGSHISKISTICDLVIAKKTNDIVMAGMKTDNVEKYIKKLQEANYTIVVYTQDSDDKTHRSLSGIFSPGTYFSNDTTKLSNNITCIWIDVFENKVINKGKFVIIGISNIDIYTGKTHIFQYKEIYINNPTTYDELERFVSIYNPSEVIFISNLPIKEIDTVINYADIKCSLIHKINILENSDSINLKRVKNCEKQTYQKEILNKFYKKEINIDNFYENNMATQSFCFLLDFVYQHNPHLVNKIKEPDFENCSERLILANHSLKQLNMIDDNNYTGIHSSVSKLLNKCITPMGKRKFLYNLLNPITDEKILQKEYDITEHILTNYDKKDLNNLSYIKDISKWTRQMYLNKISPKSVISLYNNLKIIKDIYEFIIKDDIIVKYLNNSENNIHKIGDFCKNLQDCISNNIDIELSKDIDNCQNFEVNFIMKNVDSNLDEKTETLKNSESKLECIKNYFNELVKKQEKKGSDFVKIHETEKNNYSLICTNRRSKFLEASLPISETIVKLTTEISETFDFFISKKTFEFCKQGISNVSIEDKQINTLCKNISNIKISLKDIISEVFNKFVEKLKMFQNELDCIINFITNIDIIFTKANIATKYNLFKPIFVESEKSCIKAKNLRHCLIECLLEKLQSDELYIANDITIGNGEIDGMLLYGTNAVGKTSLIKSIGIAVIMAQAGLYVPSEKFEYKPYKYLFTRIIGNDNIFKGLSTFAVEMSELRTILRLANENSLILGDELCSGTENTSAVSIFVAGIQKLHSSNSSFIFATHLHEITKYEEITSLNTVVMKHLSVIYDKEKDVLVYDRKLKDGAGDSMYGLEVCKSLNLPQDFLKNAYAIRNKYNPENKSLLDLKTSHYNSNKIVGICEKCNENVGVEVHHLQYQKEADENGIIKNNDMIFHKNNLANLLTVCDKCHQEIHTKNIQQKKVKRLKKNI
jgi:DNA mismatch repair protein MutS